MPCRFSLEQVNNATVYLVALNGQLVALSGNSTLLTSKAPGKQGGKTGECVPGHGAVKGPDHRHGMPCNAAVLGSSLAPWHPSKH